LLLPVVIAFLPAVGVRDPVKPGMPPVGTDKTSVPIRVIRGLFFYFDLAFAFALWRQE
jgi:hypothetical protein